MFYTPLFHLLNIVFLEGFHIQNHYYSMFIPQYPLYSSFDRPSSRIGAACRFPVKPTISHISLFTYWLFAYKNSILQAHQRQDVVSKVTIVTDTCKYILQIGTLFAFHNYYYYVCVLLLSQIFNNILTAIVSNKLYPQYQAEGKLPKESVKEINQKIKDLFTSKLGFTIVSSADTVVISAFLGLEALAIYQNYYYIISEFKFRDKSSGWGYNLTAKYIQVDH